MGFTEKELQVFEALKNMDNWKVYAARISKQTGIPVSTVHHIFNRNKKMIKLGVEISLN